MRILILVLLIPFGNAAQSVKPLWCQELNREKGLTSEAYNFYVYTDSQNYIWVSSTKGLNRFDGQQVKQYNSNFQDSTALYGENIQSTFYEDAEQQLWFCTYEAIHFYDRNKDQFQHFFVQDKNGTLVKQDYYVFHLEQNKYLWFRAGRAIYRVDVSDKTKLQNAFAQSKPIFITKHFHIDAGVDNDGKVAFIFGYSDKKKKGLELTPIEAGVPEKSLYFFDKKDSIHLESDIFQVHYFSPDAIWLSSNHGLIKWNYQNNSNNVFTFNHKQYLFFEPTASGKFIVSVYNNGLFEFDPGTGEYKAFHLKSVEQPKAAISPALRNIYLDANGVLWITVWDKGVLYTHLDKTKFFVPETALPESVDYSFLQLQPYLNNQILASTQNGILLLEESGKITDQLTKDDFPLTRYFYWEPGTEQIWIASNKGIYQCNLRNKMLKIVPGTSGSDFLSIAKMQDGSLLAGSLYAGLFRVEKIKDKWQARKMETGEKAGTSYTTIFQDSSGRIFICINEAAVHIYKMISGKLQLQEKLPVQGAVYSFHEDEKKDKIWIATSFGLVQLKTETNTLKTFTTENGLIDNTVYNIFADHENKLWLNTYKGISLFDPATEKCRNFTLSDGTLSNAFKPFNAIRHKENTFLIAGNNGLTFIKPDEISYLKKQPVIHVNKLYVNDELSKNIQDKHFGVRHISQVQSLEFPYDKNTLSFEFLASDYTEAAQPLLSYQLEALDEHWIDIQKGMPGFVRYANIPAGQYNFRIKAKNEDGTFIENSLREIAIQISPPFWETIWFRMSVLLLTGMICYGMFQYHVNQVREKEQLKTRIAESKMTSLVAQMKPHFIFNCLQSVNRYILKENRKDASEYLGRFGKLIRMMLENSRNNSHTLREEISFLQIYMEMEARRFKQPFTCKIETDPELDIENTEIPTMILQPIIENAIWHGLSHKAESGNILLNIQAQENTLHCTITDNGVGRAEAARIASHKPKGHHSRGTEIVQERLHLFFPAQRELCSIIYEDLKTASGAPGGTRVCITLPLC